MKELSGTSRNFFFTPRDEKLVPQVELIIVVSEPTYELTVDAGLNQNRIAETLRITTNRTGLKKLIESLLEIDKELEEMEKLK